MVRAVSRARSGIVGRRSATRPRSSGSETSSRTWSMQRRGGSSVGAVERTPGSASRANARSGGNDGVEVRERRLRRRRARRAASRSPARATPTRRRTNPRPIRKLVTRSWSAASLRPRAATTWSRLRIRPERSWVLGAQERLVHLRRVLERAPAEARRAPGSPRRRRTSISALPNWSRNIWRSARTSDWSVVRTWSSWTELEVWWTGSVVLARPPRAFGLPGLVSTKRLPSRNRRGRSWNCASSWSGQRLVVELHRHQGRGLLRSPSLWQRGLLAVGLGLKRRVVRRRGARPWSPRRR